MTRRGPRERCSSDSTAKHNRPVAVDTARALARRIAELRLVGRTTAGVTLGQLARLYLAHRAPQLSAERRRLASEMYAPRFLHHFGDAFNVEDLSQTHVDGYVVARRRGALKTRRTGASGPTPATARSGMS